MDIKYNASWVVLTYSASSAEIDFLNDLLRVWEDHLTFPPKGKSVPERPYSPLDVRNPVWFSYLTRRTRERVYDLYRVGDTYKVYLPTGLLSLVLEKEWITAPLRRALKNILTIIQGRMPPFNFKKVLESSLELRDYQVDAVKDILENPRGFIVAVPGAGKTFMGIAVILAAPSDKKILWLTHTKSLQKQSYQRIVKFVNEPVGLIGEGMEDTTKRITVGMFQTIYRRLKEKDERFVEFIRSVDVLFVDEAHHLAADTFYFVTQQAVRAYARIALTATPYRDYTPENLFLWGAISPRIVEVEAPTVPVELVYYDMTGSVKQTPPTNLRDGRMLFEWEYTNAIVRNPHRNKLIALEAIIHRPSLILVTRIEHGELLKREIETVASAHRIPIKVTFLHGVHPGEMRVQAMRMIDEGKLDIAILSDIGKEGLDVTNIKSVILAAGQKSKVAVIQRAGRGLRPKKYGKVRIVDFIDDGQIVRTHSYQRRKTLKSELDVSTEIRKSWKDGILSLSKRLRESRSAALSGNLSLFTSQ